MIKETVEKSDVRYGYFRVSSSTKGRYGYITVALIRPPKDRSHNQYSVGFSFCSPNDVFRKPLGRKIATGRLVDRDNNTTSWCNIKFDSQENVLSKAFDLALKKAVQADIVPGWVLRAYKRGQIQFGLTQRREHKPGRFGQ